ncbi:endonuclease domain-containing protein [Paenarthrobacter sp. NPDC057981]|uniref:endonuclease domain-containing protein n=1 Tax=Paenarthrobacter sp. NPDC057981 TaxID=3346297 RepID=UPI0036DE983F
MVSDIIVALLSCKACGGEFTKPDYATTRSPEYCSEHCRQEARSLRAQKYNSEAAAEIASGLRARPSRAVAAGHQGARRVEVSVCEECGREFPRGESRKPRLTCGDECYRRRRARQTGIIRAQKRAIRLEEQAQWALDNPPPPPPGPPSVICTECGEEFLVEREGSRAGALPLTCGDECRKKRNGRLARERGAELSACEIEGCDRSRWTPGIPWCTLHYSRSQRYGDPLAEPSRRKPTGTCHWCQELAPDKRLFCSAECRREDARRRWSGGPFSECAFCGKPNEGRPNEKFCSGDCYNLFLRAAKYGVTVAVLRDLLGEDGLCAICEEREGEHIDHDHLTGQVRGLLCGQCNVGLGMFQDSEEVLTKAAAYIRAASGIRNSGVNYVTSAAV